MLTAAVVPLPARGVAAAAPHTLRILVTNDDGVHAPGIDALVEALRALPNVEVTVVAPAENQTGSGDQSHADAASLTSSTTSTLSGYPAVAVDGFPADAVQWALEGGVPSRPNVVVSGVNAGQNLGVVIPTSGTIGAARTAARAGIRALAASQGRAGGDPPDYTPAARRAAAWVRSHRAALLASQGARQANVVDVDNLNVPTCTTGRVRGLLRVPVGGENLPRIDCASTATHAPDDVTAFANGYATLSTLPVSAVCNRWVAARDQSATIQDPALDEVSGVVASRAYPPVLWVHNDSGGEPAAYAVSPSGQALGEYRVQGATALDWEDIAIGPGPEPDRSYLYLGDIGDNRGSRESIVVYRVAEPSQRPDGTGGTLMGTESFTLHYRTGPVDAESLFVDPRRGDLFVIDKQLLGGRARVFRARKEQLVDGADITMDVVATFTLPGDETANSAVLLPGTLVTGADVSPDGSIVLVRTYRRVLAFARPKGRPLTDAFRVDPCSAPQIDETQGEAVGFLADGTGYVTTSEGEHAPIHMFVARN